MAAVEPLCRLFGVDPKNLSKDESILLETDLFILICNELVEIFRTQ